MGEAATPSSFNRQSNLQTDSVMSRSRSVTPSRKSSGSLHQSDLHYSRPTSAKPPRFGEYRSTPPRSPDAHFHKPPAGPGLNAARSLANSLPRDAGDAYSVPSRSEILPHPSSSMASSRDLEGAFHDHSLRGSPPPEHGMLHDPDIQEQTEKLSAMIRAIEAQLQEQDGVYQSLGLTPSKIGETAKWAAAVDPRTGMQDSSPRPSSLTGQRVHTPISSDTLTKANSEGRTVVITGMLQEP
jgi:hypothetical protein